MEGFGQTCRGGCGDCVVGNVRVGLAYFVQLLAVFLFEHVQQQVNYYPPNFRILFRRGLIHTFQIQLPKQSSKPPALQLQLLQSHSHIQHASQASH